MLRRGNYSWAYPYLENFFSDKKLSLIVEVGSRDASDAIDLSKTFDSSVWLFEADPRNAEVCRKAIKLHGTLPLRLSEVALSNVSGSVNFHSVNPEEYSNVGVSSLFPINFGKRPKNDPDRDRGPVQELIRVPAARFDEISKDAPDLICMDVEGAELKVLRGFGGLLQDVKAVVFETSFWNNYRGDAALFPDLHRFLRRSGFRFVASNRFGEKMPRNSLRRLMRPMYQPGFDCLYVRGGLPDYSKLIRLSRVPG